MEIKQATLCLALLSSVNNIVPSNEQKVDQVEEIFTYIYKNNCWLSQESISGPGSELRVTHNMRQALTALIKRFGITAIADAPCGDLNWMKHVDIGDCRYIGVDIVQELIENNKKLFGSTREFMHLNLIEDIIEKVDLIICRDMLAHLTDEQIFKVLKNFKQSGAKYLLATANLQSTGNTQISRAGDWRKLNLELPPFNFPRPLALIQEDVPFEWERGKHLAL